MWIIFITYFCVGGICNSETSLGSNFLTKAQCEKSRAALAAGRYEFVSENGKPKAIPLSATRCQPK